MFKIICLVLLVVILTSAKTQKKFVNFGGFICPREEGALGKCLKDALNSYIPKLAGGVPEFGVPSCEPLIVPTITIQQAAGAMTVMSSYSDVTVRGPSTMKVRDVKVDTAKKQVIAILFIPELRMKGNYNLSGQLLMLPIEGEGQFTATYGDIDATVTINLGRQPRPDGPDVLKCEQLDVKFQIGRATMDMKNLFGGDSDLGATMNQFINENWQKLAEDLQAPMQEALRDFLKPLADSTFATLNADDMLLD